MNTHAIDAFRRRLSKIGIETEFSGNIPWIYLTKVNGHKIREVYMGDHGFTAFWYPIRNGGSVTFTSIREVFKIIRKYK